MVVRNFNIGVIPVSKITRRDFINGTLMAAGASMLPFKGTSQAVMAALKPSYYPPARTGLRGSHPGSDDVAHALAWDGRPDWGPTTKLPESYDLVVVGGGLSGLSAAYFYQQEHGRDKKVLILDNHDDFGVMPKGMNIRLVVIHYWAKAVQSPLNRHMNLEKPYAIL